MNCPESRELLHGYLDGELELVASRELERHLDGCPNCAGEYQQLQALRTALESEALYFRPAPALRNRIRAAVRSEAPLPAPAASSWFDWRALRVALGTAAVMILLLGPFLMRRPAEEVLPAEIIASHVRSLQVNHLTDVASSDQHTVKPWFAGKVNFSPTVADLADQGFPLIGGRLDYLANRPVAAVAYHRHQHVINLFMWPAPGQPNRAERRFRQQGYQVIGWAQQGMNFWAVSDVNLEELRMFVQLVQRGIPAGDDPPAQPSSTGDTR